MMEILKNLNYSVFGKPNLDLDVDSGSSNETKLKTYFKLKSYLNQSTVSITPTRGMIDARVVNAWFNMVTPVNQRYVRFFVSGGEVADSYNTAIAGVLSHPQLSHYKYLLTMEDDNIPPVNGLLKLLESMTEAESEGKPLWAVSGLYWSKGEDRGVPIAFGDPTLKEWNIFTIPFKERGLTDCCLIPQGFTLYKMDLFRKLSYPWFRTINHDPDHPENRHLTSQTQDVYFFRKCFDAGLRVGVRADVRVGHLDTETDHVW